MSFKKITTSAVVAMSLLAANLSPLATAANAGEGWRKHDNRNSSSSYDRFRKDKHNRYSDYRRYDRHDHHRDRSGKNVAKGIAIGLGILAVGSILASEAHR